MTTLLLLHLLLTLFPSCTCVYLLSCRPYSQFTVEDVFGNLACIDCPRCLPGYGLSPKCGSYVKYGTNIGCKPCTLGVTYSATHDIDSCHPCKICSDHQKVIRNCTLKSNSKCNHSCSTGFYYEDMTGDCQACSFCCSDGRNTVKDECKDVPFYKQCDANEFSCQPKCQDDQYLVVKRKGAPQCQNCKDCPAGSSLYPQCGSIVENTDDIKCVECNAGKTFSGETGKQPCKTCTECSIGQKELRPCNLTHDRVCGKCNKGFYNVTDTECKPCSTCCGDDNDVRIPYCIKQNMPKNKQCSFTKRAINVCQHTKQGKSTGLIIAVVMATIVVAAIGILVLCKNSKYRKYPCIKQPVARSQSLPVLLPSSEEESWSHSIILEDPIAHGVQGSLTFEKSGASIQFSDGGNFYCDAQGVNEAEVKLPMIDKSYSLETKSLESTEPLLKEDQEILTCSCEVDIKEDGAKETLTKLHGLEPVLQESREPLPKEENPGTLTCAGEMDTKKDSKLLNSLLDHEDDLRKISVRLNTPKPGVGNYKVVAQHYGLDHYEISSDLEKGRSTALLEWLSASKPKLTVQEFAAVVKEKAKREDVVEVLLAYDSNNK